MSDRLTKLLPLLEKTPRDTFLLYAVGMECKKLREFDRAIQYFKKATDVDPAYAYAYYQIGQTHELAGDTAAAKAAYQSGIAAAQKAGDGHAAGEIAAALEAIG